MNVEEKMNVEDVDTDDDDDDDDDDDEDDDDDMDGAAGSSSKQRTYLPGQPIEEGEELVCDESAYIMYHQAQTGAPCLSFDVIRDGLGDCRGDTYPLACYTVAGTQASRSHINNLVVMKMSNLHPVKHSKKNDDDEDGDDDDENEAKQPRLDTIMIPHSTAVNRVRATVVGERHFAGTWCENSCVYIWDTTDAIRQVDNAQSSGVGGGKTSAGVAKKKSSATTINQKPLFTFKGHRSEGFALDWSRLTPGRLVSGDCSSDIHVWSMNEGGSWSVDQRSYAGHTQSVEDLQWSPTEPTVFASCSVDKSIRIYDTRAAPHKACMITLHNAHDTDVNVISWNCQEARFIVSGGDDGLIKVWDLAQYKQQNSSDSLDASMTPVGKFKHHTAQVTSVEWHPTDSSVFAAAGADDQISQWDIAVEREAESKQDDLDVLPQLLFIHQGQKEIKELHWHPQLPGVIISTALSGFNVFRTISV